MNVPSLRFKMDNGQSFPEWQVFQLSDLATRVTRKNKENNLNVLTISAQLGLINQEEYFSKSVDAKELTNYYLLHRSDFAYNKSYSKGYPMGAIKCLNRYDKGVVSTLYICFKFNDENINSYIEHYFETGLQNAEIEKFAQEGARNHGLLNIGLDDFFSINLTIPSSDEQRKIVNFLTSVDEKITQLTEKCELLTQYKKGVMQHIFNQELRFKGDDGQEFPEWVGASFDDLFYVANNKKTQLKSSEYLEVGNTPIVDQGQKLIVGYTNNAEVYEDIPVIIFGDHTRIIKWIDFQFVAGADGTQVLKSKSLLDLKFGYYALSNIELPNLGYSRHMKELKEQFFIIPSSEAEQVKIANFLTAVDNKLTRAQNQLVAAKQYKQGLLQQMFV